MDDSDENKTENPEHELESIDSWVDGKSRSKDFLFPYVQRMKDSIEDISEQFPNVDLSICNPKALKVMLENENSPLRKGNVLATCEQGIWRSRLLRNAMFDYGANDYLSKNAKRQPDKGVSIKDLAAVVGQYDKDLDRFTSRFDESLDAIIICTDEIRMPLTLESLRKGLSLGMPDAAKSRMPLKVIFVLGTEAKFNGSFSEYV